MAITSENMSVAGVKNILDLGRNSLNMVQSKIYGKKNQFDVEIERLEALIDQLINKENQMMNLLGCTDIEDFKRRLNKFYEESKFNLFSGLDLKNLFIKDFKAEAKTIKQNQNIDELKLAQYIINQLSKDQSLNGKTGNNLKTELTKMFHGALTAKITENGTSFSSTVTDKFIQIDKTGAAHAVIEGLTPAILGRLRSILAEINGGKGEYTFANKKVGSGQHDLQTLLKGYQVSQNTLTINLQSKWLQETQGYTATEIREMIKKDPKMKQKRDKVNNNLINLIVSKVDPMAQQPLRNTLSQMVKSNPEMFYVGIDEKQIIGLLGEAAAYTALSTLFKGKFSFQWVAQNLQGGRQLSSDLLLKKGLETYGIQIKNSAQVDLSNLEIAMMSPTSIDTVFNKLGVSQAIGNALETSHFNLSYIVDVPVVPGGNPVFDGIQSALENFKQQVHIFLFRYAPELLYIQNEERTDRIVATLTTALQQMGTSGNILYIVAGQPHFASEQLMRVKEQILLLKNYYTQQIVSVDEQSAFHISLSGKTIVDVLNSYAANHKSIKLSDVSVKMTSSMSF